MKMPFASMAAVLLAGCGTVSFARVGAIQPPQPAGCPVSFSHLTSAEAFALGEHEVAMGCALNYPDPAGGYATTFTSQMEADVAPRACALGGDMVIVTGQCNTQSITPGLELMVLTRRR